MVRNGRIGARSDPETRPPGTGRARRWPRARGAAVALAIAGHLALGSFQLLLDAPWSHPDEVAHAGYAQSLASGRLPTVDTPIEVPAHADLLERRLDSYGRGRDDPHRKVWVANHPPGAYLLSAPIIVLALPSQGDSLSYAMRLANLVAGAVVIWLVGQLAFALTHEDLAAVVASLLTALQVYFAGSMATGLTDGWALVFAVAVMWRGVVAWQEQFEARAMWQLGAVIAGCGLVRITSLGVGVAVAVTCVAAESVRTRALPWMNLLRTSLPAALFAGWFYVRNWWLYGDIAGSEQLLDRFNRIPRGSLVDTLTETSIWTRLVRVVLGERADFYGSAFVEPRAWSAYLACVGGLAVLVVIVVRARDLQRNDGPNRLRAGWLLLVAASVANLVMVAQHISGGGNPYGRYLLLAAPIWSCLVAAAVVANGLNATLRRLLIAAALAVLVVRQFARRYSSYAFLRDYGPRNEAGVSWSVMTATFFLAAALFVGGIVCAVRLPDPAAGEATSGVTGRRRRPR